MPFSDDAPRGFDQVMPYLVPDHFQAVAVDNEA